MTYYGELISIFPGAHVRRVFSPLVSSISQSWDGNSRSYIIPGVNTYKSLFFWNTDFYSPIDGCLTVEWFKSFRLDQWVWVSHPSRRRMGVRFHTSPLFSMISSHWAPGRMFLVKCTQNKMVGHTKVQTNMQILNFQRISTKSGMLTIWQFVVKFKLSSSMTKSLLFPKLFTYKANALNQL